jgi:hypothetical protein
MFATAGGPSFAGRPLTWNLLFARQPEPDLEFTEEELEQTMDVRSSPPQKSPKKSGGSPLIWILLLVVAGGGAYVAMEPEMVMDVVGPLLGETPEPPPQPPVARKPAPPKPMPSTQPGQPQQVAPAPDIAGSRTGTNTDTGARTGAKYADRVSPRTDGAEEHPNSCCQCASDDSNAGSAVHRRTKGDGSAEPGSASPKSLSPEGCGRDKARSGHSSWNRLHDSRWRLAGARVGLLRAKRLRHQRMACRKTAEAEALTHSSAIHIEF